jgi:hypothetical protein
MLTRVAIAMCLIQLQPALCRADVVINEVGDFPGTLASPTLSQNIGTLTDFITQLNGTIAGSPDTVDAWTFTVPASWHVTGVNVIASGFDGTNDFVDIYSNLGSNPNLVAGDLLSGPLTVGTVSPLSMIGPGTYKLSAVSAENASYSIQITAVPEASAFVFGVAVCMVGSVGYVLRRSRRAIA